MKRSDAPPRGGKWIAALWQAAFILALAGAAGLSSNALRGEKLPILAKIAAASPASTGAGEPGAVTLDEAEALFLSGTAVFVDARPRDLFLEGHLRGARNIPPERSDGDISRIMADVTRDATIVAYCDGEDCGLSRMLAADLVARGYPNARVLENGWTLWKASRLPTEPSTQ